MAEGKSQIPRTKPQKVTRNLLLIRSLRPEDVIPKNGAKLKFCWDLGFEVLGIAAPTERLGGQRDSNPQQPEPQSGALPLSYGHRLSREL